MDKETPDKRQALSGSLACCVLMMNKPLVAPDVALPSAHEENDCDHSRELYTMPNNLPGYLIPPPT